MTVCSELYCSYAQLRSICCRLLALMGTRSVHTLLMAYILIPGLLQWVTAPTALPHSTEDSREV